jgi:hypothetical protein
MISETHPDRYHLGALLQLPENGRHIVCSCSDFGPLPAKTVDSDIASELIPRRDNRANQSFPSIRQTKYIRTHRKNHKFSVSPSSG